MTKRKRTDTEVKKRNKS